MQSYQQSIQSEAFVFDAEDSHIMELENDDWQMQIVADRRRAPRISVSVLHILETDNFRELDVVDLSMSGLRISHNGWRFTPGDRLIFDIIYRDRFVIKNARARVVRVNDSYIGCKFINIAPAVGEKLARLAAFAL